eukprot:sb/3463094/
MHESFIANPGLFQGLSRLIKRFGYKNSFFAEHDDRLKRDFISAGAAAGVSAAFGAPLGGVLFSLEEGSSFWNQALTWKTCLDGDDQCLLWGLSDLVVFIIIGAVGGLLGAAFNQLNLYLTQFRFKHVNPRGRLVRLDPVISESMLKHGNCSGGLYNDYMTLAFTSQEDSIKLLFHHFNHSVNPEGDLVVPRSPTYHVLTLVVLFVVLFFAACWTYGIGVPSGLFVPSLLIGAVYGRICGYLYQILFISDHNEETGDSAFYPGTYSLIGAAAFLGGVVRMTISLTVILIETTRNISYGLPIMLTLMVAKWVGDFFNRGLYDIHIELKHWPLLEWEAHSTAEKISAADIMQTKLEWISPTPTVGLARQLAPIWRQLALNSPIFGGLSKIPYLRRTQWVRYAFYPGTYSLIGAAAFLGGVVRMTISLTVILIETTRNISYGLPIMLTLMVAKWVGDLFNRGLYDIHIELKHWPLLEWEAHSTAEKISAADIMQTKLEWISPTPTVGRLVDILKRTKHSAFPVCVYTSCNPKEHEGCDGALHNRSHLKLVGLILRSQIVTLLKLEHFRKISDEKLPLISYPELTQFYPKHPDIDDVTLEFDQQNLVMVSVGIEFELQ